MSRKISKKYKNSTKKVFNLLIINGSDVGSFSIALFSEGFFAKALFFVENTCNFIKNIVKYLIRFTKARKEVRTGAIHF